MTTLGRRVRTKIAQHSPSNLAPPRRVRTVDAALKPVIGRRRHFFGHALQSGVTRTNVRLLGCSQLARTRHHCLRRCFSRLLFPILAPLTISPIRPFPCVSGLDLGLTIIMRSPRARVARFTEIGIPGILPQFVTVPRRL